MKPTSDLGSAPIQQTHFDLLGLPRRYLLGPEELEARYRELSRMWHPDQHSRAAPAERVRVLQRAMDLNEAYRALRGDLSRAVYLLKLHGVDVSAEGAGAGAKVDGAFLMEILELREALVEARQARDESRIAVLDKGVRARTAQALSRVAAGFLRLEAGDEAALQEIATQVVALRYFQRFRDEIDAYEENA